MTSANPDNVKRALALALDVAFATKDIEMINQAIAKGADAQVALRHGHATYNWQIIDAALKGGADINGSIDGGAASDTFVIASVRSNMLSFAEGYLDRGADPNLTLGKETALELVLTQMKQRKAAGSDVSVGQTQLSKRLLAALPDPHNEADMGLKKEVTLRAPQAAFKGAGQKPAQ